MSQPSNYPQIPATIWWRLREFLIAKPTVQLTPKIIAVQFGVQETAAKAYVRDLQKVGMLDEEQRPTDIAKAWRIDETYQESKNKILEKVYPKELLDTLDLESVDRSKAKNWFMLDGLGSGAAGNKAATLALIASPVPGETPTSSAKELSTKSSKAKLSTQPSTQSVPSEKLETTNLAGDSFPPLNVNVQIHISADASSDQIEKIFQSMRKYLYENNIT